MATPNRPNRSAPRRTPVGQRNKLTAPTREGYKRRFVNDVDGRVQMFLDAGYAIVTDTDIGDKNVGESTRVGKNSTKPVGGGMNAVLMEIKEDWYNEDQAVKAKRIKEKEGGLLNGENGQPVDQTNLYGEGVKLSSSTKRPIIQIDN